MGVGYVIKIITTSKDNRTPSSVRIFALIFVIIQVAVGIQFMALAAYAKDAFEATVYGVGAAALFASQWAGLAAYAKSLQWSFGSNSGDGFDIASSTETTTTTTSSTSATSADETEV
jgi:hypothetical protein